MKYGLKAKNNHDYFFISKNAKGYYEILKCDNNACMITSTYLGNDFFTWLDTPVFPSFIKAVIYLKSHVNELL